jgi:uncharacterized protein (DUF433 family)
MATELKTEHPHIVRVPGVLGGEPVITGTRVAVALIARLLQAGEEPSEIVASFPRLAPAAVYDAVSYYLDHRDEIESLTSGETLEALASRYGFVVQENGRIAFSA